MDCVVGACISRFDRGGFKHNSTIRSKVAASLDSITSLAINFCFSKVVHDPQLIYFRDQSLKNSNTLQIGGKHNIVESRFITNLSHSDEPEIRSRGFSLIHRDPIISLARLHGLETTKCCSM